MSYEYGELWDSILSDGSRFCHWGGKQTSRLVINALRIQSSDTILELCCGKGGTLKMLLDFVRTNNFSNVAVWGVDISRLAVQSAGHFIFSKAGSTNQVTLVATDAVEFLETCGANDFPASFNKIYMQDGDVWLRPER